jgi:pimeloyl-ACP methyl ester carboxylesterase
MRTRMVKTPDVDLYVVEDGDPKNPGILFLHGFPDSHRVWENQLHALARDFHVIAFDLRGCGNSGEVHGRDNYRIHNLLPDILAVINATRGPAGKVHLVAHDWGSVLGWSFVAEPRYAARVESWTSMSGPHVGLLWQWLYRKVTSGRLADLKAAAEQFAHSWYIFALNIPGAGRALFRFAGVEVWKQAMKQGGVPAADPCLHITQDEVERITLNTIGLYQQNAFRPPALPAPRSVQVPTQLIVPLDDAFIRPGLFEYLDETCTNLTRVTLDANHWAQRSHAEEFNTLIRGFVTRLARAAAPASVSEEAVAAAKPPQSSAAAAARTAPRAKTGTATKAAESKKATRPAAKKSPAQVAVPAKPARRKAPAPVKPVASGKSDNTARGKKNA